MALLFVRDCPLKTLRCYDAGKLMSSLFVVPPSHPSSHRGISCADWEVLAGSASLSAHLVPAGSPTAGFVRRAPEPGFQVFSLPLVGNLRDRGSF